MKKWIFEIETGNTPFPPGEQYGVVAETKEKAVELFMDQTEISYADSREYKYLKEDMIDYNEHIIVREFDEEEDDWDDFEPFKKGGKVYHSNWYF